MQRGLLLINIGTPNSSNVSGVRSFLRQFLTDKYVIDLPVLLRYLLVYCFIIPLRSAKTASAYQEIWTDEGSPLLSFSTELVRQLQSQLGPEYTVAIGMHYSEPSIEQALDQLKHCQSLSILPLYPQYSSAATGSAFDKVTYQLDSMGNIPDFRFISDFYQHPAYIKVQAKLIQNHLNDEDYVLFSYHGIPERQLLKSGCTSVCKSLCPKPSVKNSKCYKAQCEETSRLLAKELNLPDSRFISSFQSRLGKLPWIRPYTDEVLVQLAAQGIKNLVVACPSFVTDCLETLEEIGMRARKQWLSLGGERFTLVPSLNADPAWISAIIEMTNI